MIDHITYQMPMEELLDQAIGAFFDCVGMYEIEASEVVPLRWRVRWFASGESCPNIHLVSAPNTPLTGIGLGHFCVRVGIVLYERARRSRWCIHDSGSGRIWLCGPGGLRAEVRP